MTEDNSLSSHDEIKQLVAEPKFRIKLYDYVRMNSDALIAATTEEFFPLNAQFNSNELASRLKRYEETSADLIAVMSLIGLWGNLDHQLSVRVPIKQFAVQLGNDARNNAWTSLRLYPLVLLMYALGIGAITANNYSVLHTFFQSTFRDNFHSTNGLPLVFSLGENFGTASGLFKALPGYERFHVPASEYLYSFFKDKLKEVIFLGDDYEYIFDQFEILYALEHAYEREKISKGHVWGPVGRFGWKYSRGGDANPFKRLYDEASNKEESWDPLRAGFFDSSYERFEKLAQQYTQFLESFHW